MTAPFLIWLSGLCALAYLPLSPRPDSTVRSTIKTLAVAGLAMSAVLNGAPILLVVALGLCALGDFCLSRPGDRAFMAGVGSFALGHIAYMGLFLSRAASDPGRISSWPQIAVLLGLILLGAVMARQLAPKAGALRGAVLAYIPVILSMGLAALTLPLGHPALLAALAFVTSDVILACEKFLLAADHPARRVTPFAIWALYWLAQVTFCLSLA